MLVSSVPSFDRDRRLRYNTFSGFDGPESFKLQTKPWTIRIVLHTYMYIYLATGYGFIGLLRMEEKGTPSVIQPHSSRRDLFVTPSEIENWNRRHDGLKLHDVVGMCIGRNFL